MAFNPRPYQTAAVRFLTTRPGAVLALEMGLGKTACAMWAIEEVEAQAVLLIVPKNLKRQWMLEIEKTLGVTGKVDYPFQVVFPKDQTPRFTLSTGQRITLAHPEQFVNGSKWLPYYQKKQWDVVCVDEAHRIKNPQAQRSKNISKLRSTYRWALTGTPMSEKPIDLYGLLKFADKRRWSSKIAFAKTYCEEIYNPFSEWPKVGPIKEDMRAQLRQVTRPYVFTKSLADVGIELPPITEVTVNLEMGEEQAAIYNKLKNDAVVWWGKQRTKSGAVTMRNTTFKLSAVARMIYLHQAASFPKPEWVTTESVKLEWIKSYVEDGGQPAVIMSRYNNTVKAIEELLTDLGVRDDYIVGTIDSLKEGHNLQRFQHIIFVDRPLELNAWSQAKARVWRCGQEHPVIVYKLACADVDDWTDKLLEQKRNALDEVLPYLRGLHDGRDNIK